MMSACQPPLPLDLKLWKDWNYGQLTNTELAPNNQKNSMNQNLTKRMQFVQFVDCISALLIRRHGPLNCCLVSHETFLSLKDYIVNQLNLCQTNKYLWPHQRCLAVRQFDLVSFDFLFCSLCGSCKHWHINKAMNIYLCLTKLESATAITFTVVVGF